ncbi:MAG: hypothetical protein ACP6IP_03175 [Candidatus Njordarchaeia archaeon]
MFPFRTPFRSWGKPIFLFVLLSLSLVVGFGNYSINDAENIKAHYNGSPFHVSRIDSSVFTIKQDVSGYLAEINVENRFYSEGTGISTIYLRFSDLNYSGGVSFSKPFSVSFWVTKNGSYEDYPSDLVYLECRSFSFTFYLEKNQSFADEVYSFVLPFFGVGEYKPQGSFSKDVYGFYHQDVVFNRDYNGVVFQRVLDIVEEFQPSFGSYLKDLVSLTDLVGVHVSYNFGEISFSFHISFPQFLKGFDGNASIDFFFPFLEYGGDLGLSGVGSASFDMYLKLKNLDFKKIPNFVDVYKNIEDAFDLIPAFQLHFETSGSTLSTYLTSENKTVSFTFTIGYFPKLKPDIFDSWQLKLFSNKFDVYVSNVGFGEARNVTVTLIISRFVRILSGDNIFKVDAIKPGSTVKVGSIVLTTNRSFTYPIEIHVNFYDVYGNSYHIVHSTIINVDNLDESLLTVYRFILAEIVLGVIGIAVCYPSVEKFYRSHFWGEKK